ncbi:MAG: L-threonylcarbamoyladenylate synthase, partial [Clostridia bacterium]|nr:L-threonylcarbamoyladenylate synthase [Clostridia bacterium]
IFKAKGRPGDNPLILHVSSIENAKKLTTCWPKSAQLCAESFWPGPLTVILPKSPTVPDAVTAGLPSVAIRMPAHPVAKALIEQANFPLAAPSANRSGAPSPTTAQHVFDDLNGKIPLILDGGPCAHGLESTVLDLTGSTPTVLRPGAVTLEMLAQVLNEVILSPAAMTQLKENEQSPSPGLKHTHYAPHAHVILYDGPGAEHIASQQAMADRAAGIASVYIQFNKGYSNLYEQLRRADDHNAETIYAVLPEGEGLALAARNRLLRAAGFKVTYVEEKA